MIMNSWVAVFVFEEEVLVDVNNIPVHVRFGLELKPPLCSKRYNT